MNIVTYSSLYPNSVNPSHGIFVERRLRQLCDSTDIAAKVVAPVPWFPFKSDFWGRYSDFASIPGTDVRHNIEIRYPRFPVIPKVGMQLTPGFMATATRPAVSSVAKSLANLRLIDAHYFFPDGVAAGIIARKLGLPFLVTARGSDINLIAKYPGPRKAILNTAKNASAIIAVSHALADELERIEVPSSKIHVLPNGVDLEAFRPGDRERARHLLGIVGPTFLTVGALKEAKGHDIAIRSLNLLPDAKLIIIGQGEFERELRALVARHRLSDRVSFTGNISESELVTYYQAADVLVLASRREGMPNVVLESLACGTPVIATAVGGIGEVVNDPIFGELVTERSAVSVANAWSALQQRGIERRRIRSGAVRFSWDQTISRLHALVINTLTQ